MAKKCVGTHFKRVSYPKLIETFLTTICNLLLVFCEAYAVNSAMFHPHLPVIAMSTGDRRLEMPDAIQSVENAELDPRYPAIHLFKAKSLPLQ